MFYIGFTTAARTDDEGWRHAEGELTLDGASETFQSDVHTWSMAEYEAQWRAAIARLLSGHTSSVLITSYRGPGAGHHFIRPMWRVGRTVYFQERIVMAEQLDRPFDPATVHVLAGDRKTLNEDGQRISEWPVPLEQLATFLSQE